MLTNTAAQPMQAFVLCLCGLGIGLLLAGVQFFRYCSGKQRISTVLADFLFTLFAGGVFLLANYAVADGVINLFCVLFYLLGMSLSYQIIKKCLQKKLPAMRQKLLDLRKRFKSTRIGKFIFK